MTIQDLATWKFIKSSAISPHGTWVSFEVNQEEGDPSVYMYNTKSGKEWAYPNASGIKVSRNEAWAAFKSSPPKAVVKRPEAPEGQRRKNYRPTPWSSKT